MEKLTHTYGKNVIIYKFSKNELAKIDFAHCAEPRETLKQFYDRQTVKPDLIINGGFFNMSNGDTVFNYMDEKELITSYALHRWGMGILQTGELKYGNMEEYDWVDFISGFPNYIDSSEKVDISYAKEIDYKARRTCLGYNHNDIYVLIVENPGCKLANCQNILLELGCTHAINLDGGGSTKALDKDGNSVTVDWTNRPVDNVVAFYLKKEKPVVETPKTLFRVQTGAYGIKTNADNWLAKIQALKSNIDMDYSKAYVRKINSLYKVQVGAFSKRENAQRVVNDLKSLGINSFITTN